jgi:hypothetical protein
MIAVGQVIVLSQLSGLCLSSVSDRVYRREAEISRPVMSALTSNVDENNRVARGVYAHLLQELQYSEPSKVGGDKDIVRGDVVTAIGSLSQVGRCFIQDSQNIIC